MEVKVKYFMKAKKIKIKNKSICNVCFSEKLKNIWYLPKLPLTEQFGRFDKKFPSFDQELVFCCVCGHLQLKRIIDPNFLYTFENYNYSTKISKSTERILKKFIDFYHRNTKKIKPTSILDIGGNDSLLIDKIIKKNIKAYIIDPVAKANNKNIKVINQIYENIFLKDHIEKIPNIIICRHTLEHIEKPKEFILKLLNETEKKSIFIFEVPSLERMLQMLRFDTIMHQHINYFDVPTLSFLINSCGGEVIEAEIYNQGPCGGSILIAFKKKNLAKLKKKNQKLRVKNKLNRIKKNIQLFKSQIEIIRFKINETNEKFYAYGAGLMSANLFYHLNLNLKKINYIIDDNPAKNNTSYKNLNLKVKYLVNKNYIKNKNILISSMENQRIIYNNISLYHPKNILMFSSTC